MAKRIVKIVLGSVVGIVGFYLLWCIGLITMLKLEERYEEDDDYYC